MNEETETIYNVQAGNLEFYLLGQTIASIDGKVVVLANGVRLSIEDTEDCCSWFEGDIEAFDFVDNVVTAVEQTPRANDEQEGRERWSIHILSAHKLIAQVNINGDHSSGYYCHSVNLVVEKGAIK